MLNCKDDLKNSYYEIQRNVKISQRCGPAT